MPLFAILAEDKPGGLDLRMSTRPQHIEWIKSLGASMKIAGPFLSADDQMVGTLMVIEADDLAGAQAIAAADPYAKAGLFATSAVRPWRLGLGGFSA